MKWMGASFVIFAMAGLGSCQAIKIRKRYEELLYIKKIMFMLRGEINYNISNMGEIFLHLSQKVKEPYKEAFLGISERIEKGDGEQLKCMWEECLIEKLNPVFIGERDKMALIELGENLGYLDKDMQLNYLNLYLENLNTSILEKRERVHADEKMSAVLGVLAGVFMVVFLW